jgi:hypothetical protein
MPWEADGSPIARFALEKVDQARVEFPKNIGDPAGHRAPSSPQAVDNLWFVR